MFAELRELLRSGAIRRHQLGSKYLLPQHHNLHISKKHGDHTKIEWEISVNLRFTGIFLLKNCIKRCTLDNVSKKTRYKQE